MPQPIQPIQPILSPKFPKPGFGATKPRLRAATFRATDPAPLKLIPGRVNRFIIRGTSLVTAVASVALVMTRTPWRLPGTIVSRSEDAITVTVSVPKYLALGPYRIEVTNANGVVTDTGLAAEADECKPCEVWTEFNPTLHGFHFDNSNWGDVRFTIVDGSLKYKEDGPFHGGDWGLCGGMSLHAGERFRAGATDTHDVQQVDAKKDVVNAQFRTLDGATVEKFFDWMCAPDEGHLLNPSHSVGIRMHRDWDELIKPELDAYRPVVLGLIFDKMATVLEQLNPLNLRKLGEQHQVLGIGYSCLSASTFVIYAYDPNVHDDILVLSFTNDQTGVDQSLDSGNALPASRRPVRGVMFVRGVP